MTQAEELFQAIGYIDDILILRSDRQKKRKSWFGVYGGLMVSAACLALLFGANYIVNRPVMDEHQPTVSTQPNHQGDGNGPDYYDPSATPIPDDDRTQQESSKDYGMMHELGWVDFNPGPIMPLTLAEEKEGITAERELLYDFSAVSKEDKGYVPIRDSYVMTNTTDKDETVTVYYPYVTDVWELSTYPPQLTVDGEVRDTTILNGAYMGEDSEGMPSLFGPTVSTDEYPSMLKEVKPLNGAIDEELMKNIPSETKTSISLPKTILDYQITWESSDIDVMLNDGLIVARDDDRMVTLIANITINDIQIKKEYDILVKAVKVSTGQYDVAYNYYASKLNKILSKNVSLMTNDYNGCKVRYISMDESIITSKGKITVIKVEQTTIMKIFVIKNNVAVVYNQEINVASLIITFKSLLIFLNFSSLFILIFF